MKSSDDRKLTRDDASHSLLPPDQNSIRKVSSSGRFTIVEAMPQNEVDRPPLSSQRPAACRRPETEPDSNREPTSEENGSVLSTLVSGTTTATTTVQATSSDRGCRRCVHFDIAEEFRRGVCRDSDHSLVSEEDFVAYVEEDHFVKEHHTQCTTKSWRHLQTLEHPPIMDFYRDSVRGVSRPTMMELLNSGTTRTSCADFETFKVEHENFVESQMSATGQSGGPANDFQSSTVYLHSHTVVDDAGDVSSNSVSLIDTVTAQSTAAIKAPPVGTPSVSRTKLGWVEGVFFRCILNIFGVMLYLRISWVAGQAGIVLGSVVVLFSSLVTMITALSTCAICTNGDVKGGGAYFLISRSLGPEFGGSIGLIFSVANAVGAAMYIVGFAETVSDIFRNNSIELIDGGLNDVRIIGLATCIVLMAIVFIGTSFESKMQMGLLVILALSIIDYLIGSFLPATDEQRRRGITGYKFDTFKENLLPSFRDGYDFFTVFSIYFPAATGIMAGANISGDLTDPQRAIPLGTVLSIVVTTTIYLLSVVLIGSTCVRDADGIHFPDTVLATVVVDQSTTAGDGRWSRPLQSYEPPACALNGSCPYGLMNNFQVMEMVSVWGPLITAGIFAATLSSALASLVSAPKIFQGYGKSDEPRSAYALGFLIAVLTILIGDLNAIAPIISNFFLCSYALINYACFDNSFAHSPGFRPSFRYYNMWISLVGSVLCVTVMFIVSWSTALLTFFFFALLFMYLSHRKPDVNWGSSTQAHSYRNALLGVTRLERTNEHVKNYRPQVLVLTGNPILRPQLVDFAAGLTKGGSLLICGCVIPYAASDSVFALGLRLREQIRLWLHRRHVKSFFACVGHPSVRAGTQAMLQLCGLGRLRPNILMMGFKHDWCRGANTVADTVEPSGNNKDRKASQSQSLAEINDYFGTIQDAFDNNMGVCILRNASGGLDMTDTLRLIHGKPTGTRTDDAAGKVSPSSATAAADNLLTKVETKRDYVVGGFDEDEDECFIDDDVNDEEEEEEEEDYTEIVADEEADRSFVVGDKMKNKSATIVCPPDVDVEAAAAADEIAARHRRRSTRHLTTVERGLLLSMNRFQRKIKRATIDVWWLYDDGGLTLLLPHLLTQRKSYLENASLRVFTIAKSASGFETEQRGMATLLNKFRIEFSDLHVITDVTRRPKKETMAEFEKLIAPFRVGSDESAHSPNHGSDHAEGLITDGEWRAQKPKIQRQLRISELLREHSTKADLIVLSMPVPRRGMISACMYMAWLDAMTRGLPTTLLVRGNQHSVLTFYS